MRPLRRSLVFPLLLVLVTSLTLLFYKASGSHEREHAAFETRLRHLREADTALNLAIISSRFGLAANYDDQTKAARILKDVGKTLDLLPGFLESGSVQTLRPLVTAYQGQLEQKLSLSERFKSENAILRNSLAYFPESTAALSRQAARPGGDARLAGHLHSLLESLLLYVQTADELEVKRIKQFLHQIEDERPGYPAAVSGEALSHVLLHAQSLLRVKPRVDSLIREIMEIQTQSGSESIFRNYRTAWEHLQFQAGVYRTLLYLFGIGLAIYTVMSYMRLRQNALALRQSNVELEEHIAAQRRAEATLRLYSQVFSGSSEGVMITDAESRILAVNKAFCEITGHTQADVLGQTPAILHSGRQDRHFYQNLWSELSTTGQWRGEVWNRRRDGDAYPQWMSITALRDENGKVTNYVAISSDITERKQTEERIEFLAHHDALTSLPNRVLLMDRLTQALNRAQRDKADCGAVMFVDLDRFKYINDTLGHDQGDEILKLVAQRMRALVRRIDTVSRQGGDEFVVILPQMPHGDAALVARKIIAALAEPYYLGEHELTITSSIGVALFPDDGDTPQELMRNADTAMYRAKSEGRNTFRYYRADMNAEFMQSLRLENSLHHAVDRKELLLHYQPQYNVAERRITGVEALLRWNLPDLGIVPPDKFIPLAEETGLIEPIGAWALQEACRQLRAWRDAGLPHLVMAVNLSARQFTGESLVDTVLEALQSADLPPDCLELELTESVLMKDAIRSRAILQELKGMGIKVSMDDFGTGYSSLAYLTKFPLDRLKIDRAFVSGIDKSSGDATIVKATIGLAHTLGLEVVAEGVETPEQAAFLEETNCDYLQGYLISRPMPAAELEDLLARQSPAQDLFADIK